MRKERNLMLEKTSCWITQTINVENGHNKLGKESLITPVKWIEQVLDYIHVVFTLNSKFIKQCHRLKSNVSMIYSFYN